MIFSLHSKFVRNVHVDNKIPKDSKVKKYASIAKKSEDPLKTAFEAGLITKKQYDKLVKENKKEEFKTKKETVLEKKEKTKKVEKPIEKPLFEFFISEEKMTNKVSGKDEFILFNGKKLCSLMDLYIAIDNMPNEVFSHHTKEGRNDFSKWIEGVFNENKLAKRVNLASSKEETKAAFLNN